jgi:hypothetical protein
MNEEAKEMTHEQELGKQKIDRVVEDLFDGLNSMGNEEEVGIYFVNAVRLQHRTLQQNFFAKVLVPVLKDFSKRYNEGQYDMRNEQSCKVASKLEPLVRDEYFPFV